jgi:hypothetical protein
MKPCPNCIKHNISPCVSLDERYDFKYHQCAINNHHRSISRCKTFEDLSNEPCFMNAHVYLYASDTPMDLYFNKALELYYPHWYERLQKLIILK